MNQIKCKIIIAVSFLLLLSGCKKSESKNFSFFVAGHVYGSPYDTNFVIHPPFNEDKKFLREYPNMEFGVFTGDIVRKSVNSNWDNVDNFVKDLNMPVYFAVGNHDEGHKELFASRYGKTYYSWKSKENLFIILNPLLYGWMINGDQLTFLMNELESSSDYKNIFIFLHQVLWEDLNGQRYGIRPNSFEGRADSINFYSEIWPLLENTKKPVYMFAGDVGATLDKTAIAVNYKRNVTMIASGMGSGKNDNYVIVEINGLGKVNLKLRWLENQTLHDILCCNELVYPAY